LKHKPLASLRGKKLRGLIAAGVMVAGVGSLVLQTTPALADPQFTMVAVGSDTIQDVYNAFASNLGNTTLASYDAINPISHAAGDTLAYINNTNGKTCSFPRPNGSGAGQEAMDASVAGPLPTTTVLNPEPGVGCVDIGRSSSGPGSTAGAPNSGNYTGTNALQFVPFAEDAVDGSFGPAAGGTAFTAATHDAAGDSVPATTVATQLPVASVNMFTQQNLTDLYKNCKEITVNGTLFWPLGDPNPGETTKPANAQQIDLYIPQTSSGTTKFWAGQTGAFSLTTLPACVFTTIQNGALSVNGASNPSHFIFTNEEHDGTAIATDPFGYFPFSIAQWIAQSNGHNDRRHGAVLADLVDASAVQQVPTATKFGAVIISPNFPAPFTRLVYSVVSLAPLTTGGTALNSFLNGSGSTICQSSSTMISFGFSPLTGNANILGGATCGEITAALEAAP
jgi:hypothetical protein